MGRGPFRFTPGGDELVTKFGLGCPPKLQIPPSEDSLRPPAELLRFESPSDDFPFGISLSSDTFRNGRCPAT